MWITKIVAVSIPVVTLAIWIYFFVTTVGVTLTRFLLVSVVVPLALASFYIAFKVWHKS
jgi:hypothetical protein